MSTNVFKKKYGSKNKQSAARAAVAAARATLIANRRMPLAPARTGGFWGTRRTVNELKAIDVDPANYTVISTPSVTLLNGCAVGTEFTDRIGRKITMKSIFIRGHLIPQDDTSGPNNNRLLVVYDKQTNGTAVVATDVLKTAVPASQINLNNRDRFVILYDKCWVQGKVSNVATQSFASGPNCFKIKLYRKLNLEVQYSGTTAAVSSIATGSVYMIWLSENVATDGAIAQLSTRIRFTDG